MTNTWEQRLAEPQLRKDAPHRPDVHRGPIVPCPKQHLWRAVEDGDGLRAEGSGHHEPPFEGDQQPQQTSFFFKPQWGEGGTLWGACPEHPGGGGWFDLLKEKEPDPARPSPHRQAVGRCHHTAGPGRSPPAPLCPPQRERHCSALGPDATVHCVPAGPHGYMAGPLSRWPHAN